MENFDFWTMVQPAWEIIVMAGTLGLIYLAAQLLQQQTSKAKYELILRIAVAAVLEAEQAGGIGSEKLDQALETAQRLLKNFGIKVNLFALKAVIESTVYEQFERWKVQMSKPAADEAENSEKVIMPETTDGHYPD